MFFNPEQFNKKELELILNHEKVHANQWHSIDIIVSQIVTIIFWFNPVVWLYKKSLQQNLEYIADDRAQNSSECNSSYQKLLLKTSVQNHNLSIINNFYNSLIKKRIVMLHKNRSHRNNLLKPLLVLPLLAIFLMSFNTKTIYIEKEVDLKSNDFIGDYSFDTSGIFNTYLEEKEEAPKIATKTETPNTPAKKQITKPAAFNDVVIITKNFTKADFNKLKSNLSKQGITIKFKGIKRNKAGEIKAIKIIASNGKAEVKYNSHDNDVINPITIKFDHNNISIGDQTELHFDNGYAYRVKSETNREDNVFIISDDNDSEDEEDVEIIVSDGKKHKIRAHGSTVYEFHSDDDDDHDTESEVIIIHEDDGDKKVERIMKANNGKRIKVTATGKAYQAHVIEHNYRDNSTLSDYKGYVYIKDGKEISVEELEKIYPKLVESKSITTLDVIKGKKAIKKYGKKAKKGAVIITTGKPGSSKLYFHRNDDHDNSIIEIDRKSLINFNDDSTIVIKDATNPLILVDGKEVPSMEVHKINPDNIESVNVLKGENSTKIYGEKGKNGVIIITTKKKKN